jgi:hypothetical protein
MEILDLRSNFGGMYMAKKKIKREKTKNKLIPQQGRFKGDLVDDNRPENYELSEEFTRNNPLKTPPKKITDKKR